MITLSLLLDKIKDKEKGSASNFVGFWVVIKYVSMFFVSPCKGILLKSL
jgi:hypothetical protein